MGMTEKKAGIIERKDQNNAGNNEAEQEDALLNPDISINSV